MLKAFNELYSLDIGGFISKKPTFKYNPKTQKTEKTGENLDYLSWPDCLVLLHQNGAEKVTFGVIPSPEHHSLYLLNGALPEIRVFVNIDADRYELIYPLIDGSNDVKMDKIMQSDIHNATQRAFVKCVAINTGLGLSMWQKEDKRALEKPLELTEDMHDLMTCIRRIEKKYAAVVQRSGDARIINSALDASDKQLNAAFLGGKYLAKVEKALDELMVSYNDSES